jgi:Thioredoxin like C-terminal domain
VPGLHTYALPRDPLPPDHLAYAGSWRIGQHGGTAVAGAALKLNFGARRVFLVLGSRGRARPLRAYLDGRPIPDAAAGEDLRGARAAISEQRLYRLVDLPEAGRHTLTLRFAPGISGYAFTFG